MPEHKSLAAALLAFQKDPPHIELDAKNPHFKSKFASLAGITKAVKPKLSEEGLVYAQPLDNIEGGLPAIRTILFHPASGEQIESVSPLLLGGKTDPQSHGSAITYARRYALLAILGLVGDEDDDGNAASAPTKQRAVSPAPSASPPAAADEPEFAPELPMVEPQSVAADNLITEKQRKALFAITQKIHAVDEEFSGETVRAYMDAQFGKTSTKSLTKKEASQIFDWLEEQKASRGIE